MTRTCSRFLSISFFVLRRGGRGGFVGGQVNSKSDQMLGKDGRERNFESARSHEAIIGRARLFLTALVVARNDDEVAAVHSALCR